MSTRLPPEVKKAAEDAVRALLADQAFAAHVAQKEVDRLVKTGAMIPAERLQLGPGLELTPAGRVAELEEAIEAAIELLSGDAPDPSEALTALVWVVAEPEPDDDETDETDETGGVEEVVAETGTEAPDVEKPKRKYTRRKPPPEKKDDDGRPTAMPTGDEPLPCATCETMVEGDQAKLSWIRFREVRCADHMARTAAETDDKK